MRNVYFSFHYEDVWKVNQIRHSGLIIGAKSAGFADRSLWEEARLKNERALKALIAEGLEGTSVTAVLIGRETAGRRWVKYEIRKSIERGNALLGIHLNKLADKNRKLARRGRIPHALKARSAPVHEWTNVGDFGEWVEDAWRNQNKEPGIFTRFFR